MTPRLWLPVAGVAALLAGAAYLATHDPSLPGLYPQCPFHTLTGLHCPGCGSTRAVHALLLGDFGTALGMNPLCVVLLPFVLLGLLLQTLAFVRRQPPRELAPRGAARVLLVVVLAFWLLRNLPFAPFTALAPA